MTNLPIVALTCRQQEEKSTIKHAYLEAVESAGALPLLLPAFWKTDSKKVKTLLKSICGLLLTGGVDVDPYYFGEEPLLGQREIEPTRDEMEIFITRQALSYKLPVLGICRGMQVLNIAAGGDIYQDIYSQLKEPLKHEQRAPGTHPTHSVNISEKSRLHQIIGKRKIRVNSFHHQAVKNPAPGFVASAFSEDGVIEGLESQGENFALAVQWHPELMYFKYVESEKIFGHFIQACQSYLLSN